MFRVTKMFHQIHISHYVSVSEFNVEDCDEGFQMQAQVECHLSPIPFQESREQ